jgi:dTDP-glucose 4,6-dehydratase
MKKILITGGAGFIGSHVVRRFVLNHPNVVIVNLDKLTYAGNLENLSDIEDKANYRFVKGDIEDSGFISELFENEGFDAVIHLAAESHVDRSISHPDAFLKTNILGTFHLLDAAVKHCDLGSFLFYHISTDEVYGSLGETGLFTESTAYDPKSPYSASKASSDHLVRAYGNTFKLRYKISNCSNNYGPNQFPEKLIPLCINNIMEGRELPIYGKGENVRDWLYVEDHAEAIELIFQHGNVGETYNIGGKNEWRNIDLVRLLCDEVDLALGREAGTAQQSITFVMDRKGHDLRYAIDPSKIERDLGWVPKHTFESGLRETVGWYLNNKAWLEDVLTGEYREYYSKHYS